MWVSIRYDSEDHAKIIFKSLLPEVQEHRFERSSVSIELKAKKLVIKVNAKDGNSAKATINSVLRWVSVTTESILTFSKQIFNS